ncbi:putative eukaryotic translation initiation factor eIF-2C4 [Aspergillus undulatus]|uniref:putative eukaryotic translation initiation factor eIF-2C4 n=1 Tax=Aspergillus undulatus TaxID=1810928 RepID=UPI003CCDB3AC
MEHIDQINTLGGGLRHLRLFDTDEAKYSVPVQAVPRPGFNPTGKEIEVQMNAFPVSAFPNKTVYQYDVHIGNGAEKSAVVRKVWDSKARKAALKQTIFDGQKLAWSLANYANGINVMVDLDAEQGRPAGRTPNTFRLVVRPTRTVNLAALNSWLRGQTATSDAALEALNFLEHVLREQPSRNFLAIRRSFFDENGDHKNIGGGVLAFKGVYQAIRPALGRGLIINVDVSNTCFWARTALMGAAQALIDARDPQHLQHLLRPIPDGHGGTTESPAFFEVHRRLKKLGVRPHYQGCPVLGKDFIIKGLLNTNAKQYMIDYNNRASGTLQRMSIDAYFKMKYNLSLTYPELPIVEMTKKGVVYPMELLTIHGLHRYMWRLNEFQTSNMIRYAASRPGDRLASIQKSKRILNHTADPVLQAFNLKIDEGMIRTKARLLPAPDIEFGGRNRMNPGTAGRWDLRGKKFYLPNKKPLDCWGVGYFPGRRNTISKTQVEAFIDSMMKAYQGHGGTVPRRPIVVELREDVGEAIKKLYNSTGVKFQKDPQLLVVVVPDKNSFTYSRIKKSCDCRWGVPSQVLQSTHVAKNNPQYISNVLMKVNAKLGGTTARAVPNVNEAALKPKSMIVGGDVSHSPQGVWLPSLAAMSVCMDQFGGRYWGACEANGERVEIIARSNIEVMLTPLIREWMATVGGGKAPENIYYFRDGVSEGEVQHVLREEVPNIKSILMKLTQDQFKGKFTVVIANKRHHLRAFPKPNDRNSADKNGNPLPGTLVERDVTSPHDWDFLLYSHIALQGTARPVHYHVVLDEIKHRPQELENMIYDHCYQYMRSTTSVSLCNANMIMVPAVYYAHLVSNRARHHDDAPASSGPQSGPEIKLTNPKPQGKAADPRLLPIHGTSNRLPFGMWYI